MIQRRQRTFSAGVCFIGALMGLASACSDDDDDDTSTSVNSANGGSGGNPSAAASSGGNTGGTGASTGTVAAPAGGGAAGSGGAVTGSAGPASSSDAGVPSGDAGPASALEDAQVLYAADTLNAGEVEEARAVLPKLMNDDVREFAQQMLDEHGAARDRLLQLAGDQTISPSDSDLADELRSKSQSNIESLLGADRSTSDALYIQLQVSEHVDALELLDQLASAADSEPLRQELIAERASVETHLERARALNDDNP